MIVRAAGRSDVGCRRRTNEDRYGQDPGLGAFLVADGMGGHTAGQVASTIAIDTLLASLAAESPAGAPADRLRSAFVRANDEIFSTAQARPEFEGMGTTLVALLVADGQAAVAHIGDSRVYRIRDGSIEQLTNDHSLVGELQRRGEISAEAAREHPHRHVLTRALGVRGEAEPDVAELKLEPGDTFVLCTDGLTIHVRDEEIAKLATEGTDLDDSCARLVALARARGGEDNVTVLLVRCQG
jgi:protein phosphatase